MRGHYGSRIAGVFSGPLSEVSCLIIDIFWWYKVSMEDYAPFVFLGYWVLVALYLCVRFHILDRPTLKEYVFQVGGGGPHLF
jgi:hypothetical protein